MSSKTEPRGSLLDRGRDQQSPADTDVLRQLERILAHQLFLPSHRLSAFLRYVVETALAGHTEHLKEYVIGVEVFERSPDYNPQLDPVVRTMAGRLRSKLAEYYQNAGKADPVLIEIPRGGYAPSVSWQRPPAESLRGGAPAARGPIRRGNSVGRDAELKRLMEAYALVSSGTGAMLTISGDAGMGKTTLAEDFLAAIEGQSRAFAALGHCSERLAHTDPFAPIFECLETLQQGDSGEQIAHWMQTVAPSWYLQVAPATEAKPAPPRQASTASHERMRREFLAFLEHLAQARPVVLFLDDLHWADASTCDLLAYLGARIQETRILILATYRPAAISAKGHPFFPVKLELERRGVSRDLPLSFLGPNDVRSFIALEFPENGFPAEFAAAVHERTDGNPLFMTDMLRFLCDRSIVVRRGGCWSLEQPVSEVRKVIPLGIRSMIQLKIDQLHEQDRSLLLCASVQGLEFDSAALVPVLSLAPTEVEERLQALETAHHFVQILGEREFPDRSLSVRCRFVHVFYQNALYASLPPSRRAAYSLAIARKMVELLGDQSRTAAADLALLFEIGQDYQNATQYFLQAARNATRVFAYPEAVILCERGLERLASLPETPERNSQELMFSLTLGMSLMAARGYAAPEVEATHQRSRALCIQLGQTRHLLSVLWGLHTCEINRGDLLPALAVGNEMRQVAEGLGDSFAIAEAMFAVGSTLGFMGRWGDARPALERTFEVYPLSGHVLRSTLYVLDPCVGSLSMLGRLLAFTGALDQAVARATEAVELARRLAHPASLAYATFWLGFIYHARHEYSESVRHLESSMELSRGQGLPLFVEWGRILLGSAWTRVGRVAEGIAGMRKSIERQRQMGSFLEHSYCLTLLAEALEVEGEADEALTLCDEALEFGNRTEGRCYEPETHRVRGEILLSLGEPAQVTEAEQEFQSALKLAREANCRLLELRAAVSYFRYRRRLGDAGAGRPVLEAVVRGMIEGADSPLLMAAKQALRQE
jgi:tetratricopeptide (TPR) repeat protein